MQLDQVRDLRLQTKNICTHIYYIHTPQFGYVCAASTPDGESVGLVMELAQTSTISPPIVDKMSVNSVLQIILEDYLVPVSAGTADNCDPDMYFYTNTSGILTHMVKAGYEQEVVRRVQLARRHGEVPAFCFVCLYKHRKDIRIFCQGGLFARPLIIANRIRDISPTMTFQEALMFGCVEYVCPAEEQTICRVATCIEKIHPDVTHVEISQSSFVGLMANSVPFMTCQQGPRLSYLCHQRKQFITAGTKEPRGGVLSTELWHSHRSLVVTKSAEMTPGMAHLRATPMTVCFLSLPDNQEDAIVIKKSAIERGAMACSTTRHYVSDAIKPTTLFSEKFEKPDIVLSKKTVSYEGIKADGLPRKGTFIKGGDIIIGKTRSVSRNIGN